MRWRVSETAGRGGGAVGNAENGRRESLGTRAGVYLSGGVADRYSAPIIEERPTLNSA